MAQGGAACLSSVVLDHSLKKWMLELPFLTLMLQISPPHFITMGLSKQNRLQNGDIDPYRENQTYSFFVVQQKL